MNLSNSSSVAFRAAPSLPAGTSQRLHTSRCPPHASSTGHQVNATRRQALQLIAVAAAGIGLPRAVAARARPKKALIATLLPLVRTRDTLHDLSVGIVDGTTNQDIRRTMQTILVGNKLKDNLRESLLWLSKDAADAAQVHGREAIEYLDQVNAYYDSTDLKAKPRAEYLSFALKAIDAATAELDRTLAYFPRSEIDIARQQLTADLAP